jgi:hypothetical protein
MSYWLRLDLPSTNESDMTPKVSWLNDAEMVDLPTSSSPVHRVLLFLNATPSAATATGHYI